MISECLAVGSNSSFCFYINAAQIVDLKKLRLSADGTVEGYGDTLISPESEEYRFVHGHQGMIGGFCCASFPIAKGLARTIKRL